MRFFHIEFDGRLFVEQAICGNAGGEVHQEIGLPPMARVFNLADVLQLVVDGLYDGTFAQKDFSLMPISWFFMLLLIPVTRCIPSFQRVSNKCFDIYPLSANRSPNNLRLNTLKTSGFLSSTLPFVRQKFNNSPGRCRRGGA